MSEVFHTVKPREYASTAQVISDAIDKAGGVKRVAFALGKSRSMVAAYSDPDQPQRMTFAAIRALVRAGATGPVEDLARLAGGLFVPGRRPSESTSTLTGDLARECGDVVTKVLQLQEHVRNRAALDALACIKESDELIEVAVALRNRLLASVEVK